MERSAPLGREREPLYLFALIDHVASIAKGAG